MCSSPVNSFTLSEHKIAVILLAAGRGTRMGGDTPKLLLPMKDGKPLLVHALENALSLHPLELIVVIHPDLLPLAQGQEPTFRIPNIANTFMHPGHLPALQAIRRAFRKSITYVPNPRYEEGMGTSLAVGVSTLANLSLEAEACLVLLGDEPHVSPAIVERLAQAYSLGRPSITIPVYGDQPGPPTLFSRDLFPDLALLEGDIGGRQLLSRFPDKAVRVRFLEQERPKDVDTPEDYEALR